MSFFTSDPTKPPDVFCIAGEGAGTEGQVFSSTHAYTDVQYNHPLQGPAWLSEPLLLDKELPFGVFPWPSCKVSVQALGTCLVTVPPLQEDGELFLCLALQCILGTGSFLSELRWRRGQPPSWGCWDHSHCCLQGNTVCWLIQVLLPCQGQVGEDKDEDEA